MFSNAQTTYWAFVSKIELLVFDDGQLGTYVL